MHDAKGRELKVGDKVMLPCTVQSLGGSEGYCNVTIVSVATMPPDHQSKLHVGAINTKQLLRAEPGDDVTFEVVHDGAAFILK